MTNQQATKRSNVCEDQNPEAGLCGHFLGWVFLYKKRVYVYFLYIQVIFCIRTYAYKLTHSLTQNGSEVHYMPAGVAKFERCGSCPDTQMLTRRQTCVGIHNIYIYMCVCVNTWPLSLFMNPASGRAPLVRFQSRI